MSAGLARNWWAIGLRGAAAILFVIAILCLPSPTIASLVLMFAAYVAADGALAILAGMASGAARRALAIADPGGGDEPGSSGRRSRLAGGRNRGAGFSAGLRVGRRH